MTENNTKDLIERAKLEHEKLLDQIEKSHKLIEHSRELIAQIDKSLSRLGEL